MNNLFCNRYFNWLVLIVYVFLLSYLSLMNTQRLDVRLFIFPHVDKIVHFGMYFIFAILLFRVLHLSFSISIRIQIVISIAITIVYGGGIELMQEYFVVGRKSDIFDFFANSIGAVLGVYISWLMMKFRFNSHYSK